MARPTGFEPVTTAFGGHQVSTNWGGLGGCKSSPFNKLLVVVRASKKPFKTAAYTVYSSFGA